MKAHGASVGKLVCLLICLLVAASAALGQQTPPKQTARAAPSNSKPLLVVSLLDSGQSYSLGRSCEPGRPMLFIKLRVANQSQTPSPAVPAPDGIVVRDFTSQAWTASAGLPVIPGGATLVVVVPVRAPRNATAITGPHEFHVTVNPRRVFEQENYDHNSAGPIVANIPSGFCSARANPLKIPPLGGKTQAPPLSFPLSAKQAVAPTLKQGGGINRAAGGLNVANQPGVAKIGAASVNVMTGGGGTPYANPAVWNLDLGSCGLNGPINLSAPIYEPPENNQGDWATGVLTAAANLVPDRGELARLANPFDFWFGEALTDDTAECPQGPPQRVYSPSIQISIPVTLTASGLQQTGIEYAEVGCSEACVPDYISEGTTAVYAARIEDCLSDTDHPAVTKVLDYTGNPIQCNSADAVLGNPGYWYDVAPPWAATATLGFTDCQDTPNCVPPGSGSVSGTLAIPAQLPVPANSLRIEIAFGLQDYYDNSFVQLVWGPNIGRGPASSWGGPEPLALTRFAVQLQPIVVLPAAFIQMKVLPYTIVYQPPGNQSTGSYTATQSFGTVATIGKSTTLGNTKSFENSLKVQDGQSITAYIASLQQEDDQSQTLSQTWDHNTTFGKGLTESASHTTVRSFTLGDKGLHPAHDYALPTTCSGDNWSVNCSVSPAEQYKQEPFWDDLIVLLLNPQAAVWDLNGTPSVQLLGGADFEKVAITDLAACANSQGNGAGWTLSNGRVLTPKECQQLMQLDPFADPNHDGQAYDPSQSGRGLYLGGAGYGHDPLNYSSDSIAKFSDVFSYTTARSTNATATYDATVTDTVGFSWSNGVKLSYQYGQYGINVGFSADVTVTQGEKTTTGTSMKTTYSPSTVTTDTNATQIDGTFDDDHDFGLPSCTHMSPVNCYQPHVDVYLDELFGSYMFQDHDAVKLLHAGPQQALPPPPAPPQPSTPPHLPPRGLSAAPQPAPANSTVLVPSNAFQGGVLTGMVIGPDDQPVANTPVEIAGGLPVTLTGEVIGEQPSGCAPNDTSCQPVPPQTPPARQTASSTPPLVNCAKLLARTTASTSTPPPGLPNPASAPGAAPPQILTDAAGRFAVCVAPDAPTVAVNIPGAKVTVPAVANQAPSLPAQPPAFFQPGQVISVAGSIANVVGTQNNRSWVLNTVGAWSPDGRQTITAFQAPQQAHPGSLNLSYTGSDGRPHQVQASVFKILRAFLDRSQLHSNQGAAFEYEVQFAAQAGQSLCVEMHSSGPVMIVQQPPEVIPVDSTGLGRFGGKIRATQVVPGSAVPFELTPNIHVCGQH